MSEYGKWRATELPRHISSGWAIYKRHKEVEYRDSAEVTEKIHGWLPQNPILVGMPGSESFTHPISVSQFSRMVCRSIARNTTLIACAWGMGVIVFFVFGAIYSNVSSTAMGLLCLLMALVTVADYQKYLRFEKWITERALFFYWFYTSQVVRNGFLIWLAVGTLIGGSQLLAQHVAGGMDGAFYAYGMMYEKVRAGEWWRLLSGPYLHYSIAHYSVNLAMLLLGGSLAWGLMGSSSMSVFMLGNTFGVFAQMTWGGTLYDNCGGISAGVCALFAYVISSGMVNRELLPKGIVLQLGAILFMGGAFSELVSISAATTGHVAGTVMGLVCGLLNISWVQRRNVVTP